MKKYICGAAILSLIFCFGRADAASFMQDPARTEAAALSFTEQQFEEMGITLVKATSPKEGSTVKAGSTMNIAWNKSDFPTKDVAIVITLFESKTSDMPLVADYISLGTENTGSFKFDLPKETPGGSYYRVYIASNDANIKILAESGWFKVSSSSKYDVEVNLKEARALGSNAAAKANLSNARAQAELYYDVNTSYKNVCDKGNRGIGESVAAAGDAVESKADCDSNAAQWAAEVKLLLKQGYYCVDSTGAAVVQKKSKGKSSVSCDKTKKSVAASKSGSMVVQKLKGLEKSYGIGDMVSFSAKTIYGKSKTVPADEITVYASWVGGNSDSPGLWPGRYNTKTKSWDFEIAAPSEPGTYELNLAAYCNVYTGTFCTTETAYDVSRLSAKVKVTGSPARSSSAIKVLSPNGGEIIRNTGSVNMSWSMPTGKAYGTTEYLIPSSETDFSVGYGTNPLVRGYDLGGSASQNPNTMAIRSAPQSLGYIPDGKYKLRVYLFNYEDWNRNTQDITKAIGMDESDGYFTIDTRGANSY